MKNIFWPSLTSVEEAKRVAQETAGVAFLISIATGVITWLHVSGTYRLFDEWNQWAYVDAGLFLIVGMGLLRCSRIAAVAGLLLYAFEQYGMIAAGQSRGSFITVVFALAFINGVRATFAYHSERPLEETGIRAVSPVTGKPIHSDSPPEAEPPPSPRNFFSLRTRLIAAGVLLGIAAIIFIVASFTLKRKSPAVLMENVSPGSQSTGLSASALPAEGSHTFRLKNGEVIKGRILVDDDVFYTVDTGQGEKIVIKEDVQSVD